MNILTKTFFWTYVFISLGLELHSQRICQYLTLSDIDKPLSRKCLKAKSSSPQNHCPVLPAVQYFRTTLLYLYISNGRIVGHHLGTWEFIQPVPIVGHVRHFQFYKIRLQQIFKYFCDCSADYFFMSIPGNGILGSKSLTIFQMWSVLPYFFKNIVPFIDSLTANGSVCLRTPQEHRDEHFLSIFVLC